MAEMNASFMNLEASELQVRFNMLINKQKRVYTNFKTISTRITGRSVNDPIVQQFMQMNNEFNSLQSQLDEIQSRDESLVGSDSKLQSEFLEIYINGLDSLKSESNTQTIEPRAAANHIHLPKLSIPHFDGTVKCWPNFISAFNSLIHQNAALSKCEKFQYLRSYLKGSALSRISDIIIEDDNYDIAYKKLTERYSNERRVNSFFINEIMDYKLDHKESNQTEYANIIQFIDIHSNAISSLKQAKLKNLSDFLLVSICLNNLDRRTRSDFENSLKSHEIPTVEQLFDFLTQKAETLEILHDKVKPTSSSAPRKSLITTQPHSACSTAVKLGSQSNISPSNSSTNRNDNPANYIKKCLFCSAVDHNVYNCSDFLALDSKSRHDAIKTRKLCFACFGNHPISQCKSTHGCRHCNSKKHNSLLHDSNISKKDSDNDSNAKPLLSCHSAISATDILLGTANIIIYDAFDKPCYARAVIDSGSQITAITSQLADRLHLTPAPSSRRLLGIGSKSSLARGEVQVTLSSPLQRNLRLHTQAFIIPKITSNLPAVSFDRNSLAHLSNLKLADPQFNVSRPIDLLLGADMFTEVLSSQTHKFITGQPGAVNTKFGWIIIGRTIQTSPFQQPSHFSSSLLMVTESISDSLQKFWQSEEVTIDKPSLNPDDAYCEQLYQNTTTRDPTGRYIVALPHNTSSPLIGDNRSSATAKFIALERRLNKNRTLLDSYHAFMKEYLDLQHMTAATTPSRYIIPHHCVLKESSSTTKLRVVFNASSPTSEKATLNESLLPGPKLQRDLSQILLSFRFHNIAVCADIKMMYRQILIRPEDRHLQHILYRASPQDPIQEYELCTVTYGLSPSAFLAQRTLLQLVADHGHDYPLAAAAISNSTYVDDIVTGADNLEEAHSLIEQLNSLMRLGGFELRKWSSNKPAAISHLPSDHHENPLIFLDQSQCIKILGFQWNPSSDMFSFTIVPFSETPTKRSILSYIARMFDPLGFLTPVTFFVKSFLKKLWLANLNWDDELTAALLFEWSSFTATLDSLTSLQIPRTFLTAFSKFRILGFCDASSHGYAAAIYIQPVTENALNPLTLIKAKSRVAPVKYMTIPRLELNAALLLSRLLDSIRNDLVSSRIESISLFTDASIVLAWLHTPAHKLKVFVANRVTQILELTDLCSWDHISTLDNPADIASRGCMPHELIESELWWHGPAPYFTSPGNWPSTVSNSTESSDTSELKLIPAVTLATTVEENSTLENLTKFSKLQTALHVYAYVLRFVARCRKQTVSASLKISPDEEESSLRLILKLTQSHHFSDVLSQLQCNKSLPAFVAALTPFIDTAGLLRVGGRLRHSALEFDAKHPYLLPKKCHLSLLICDHYHLNNLHAGPRITQALIFQRFWIIGARNLIRQRIRHCIICLRFQLKPTPPIMGDLPACRTSSLAPFLQTGIDYAGPFDTKSSHLRRACIIKGYLAVFVCMATKAVHLEYVSELTTNAFLAALDRFISRRGLPSDIYSDNGTNFIGANNTLMEIHQTLADGTPDIGDYLTRRHIRWHFNPPNAPHFGGLWESTVKSVKSILCKVLTSPFTFEEYCTLFTRIEALLNSRPIFDISPDPAENIDLLTPGHFLIGRGLLQRAEPDDSEPMIISRRWKFIRQLLQSFWKQWHIRYLHTTNQRHKWTSPQPPVEVGQLALVHGINSPPMEWPIGRITAVHPGPDKIIRVVTLRVKNTTIRRPVTKIVVIPH